MENDQKNKDLDSAFKYTFVKKTERIVLIYRGVEKANSIQWVRRIACRNLLKPRARAADARSACASSAFYHFRGS